MEQSLLLQTKFLIPQMSHTYLSRPMLVEAICDDEEQRTVILAAPAGYGKTSLLTEVAAEYSDPVIWLQLDEGDNDPATLMAYLVEGFRRQFSETFLVNIQLDNSIDPNRILIILLNQLFEKERQTGILILDDYHVIHNSTVHQLITTLVENLPPAMRIIIASRNTPPLPLARWRVRNQLLDLRAEDLRITYDEAVAWLKLQSRHLSDDIVYELVRRTEGWGAGLQLVTAVIDDLSNPEDILERLHGTQYHVFDYLMEEVFYHQTETYQLFLLQSSIFQELNPETCQRVLGFKFASDMLIHLEKNGLFVTRLDESQHWFRYHQLFRDFLLSRLQIEFPDLYRDIQSKAGNYFALYEQTEKAFHHYIEAEQYDRAIDMLLYFADDYLIHGRFEEIQSYVNVIEPTIRNQSSPLQLLQARLFRFGGQLSESIRHLQGILHQQPTVANIQCQTQVELSAIYLYQGKYQQAYEVASIAVEQGQTLDVNTYVPALMQLASCIGFVKGMNEGYQIATEAYQMMQNHSHHFSQIERANLLHMLGQICWWYGNVQPAINYCHRALRLLDDVGTSLKARIYITMAIPTLYQKDYEQARHLSEQAIDICQNLQLVELMPAAYAALGNVLTRIGEIERAEVCLRAAIDHAVTIDGARYAKVMAAGYLAQNLALQGRSDEAQDIVREALAPTDDQSYVYDVYVGHSVLADMLLDSNQLIEAKAIFNKLISIGEITQYRIPLAMAYFGLAYIMLQEQQQEQALTYSQQSIALLEPSMMHQLYLDQQQRALVICRQLVQHIPENTFVHQVYESLSATIEQSPETIIIVSSDVIQVQTLGTLRIFRNHREIEPKAFASAKARDLLAYFITLRSKSVNIERAVSNIWEDDTGSVSAFHTALYRLRGALRPKGNKDKFILSEVGEYRLDGTKFDIDVVQFDTLLQRVKHEADAEQQATLLETALGLYQGTYLDRLYYEWIIVERERLERQYLQAIDAYCDLLNTDKQYQTVASWQSKALEINPYDESLHIHYMQTLSHLNNQQRLIEHYQHLRHLLSNAFDSEPMPQTQTAYQRLLNYKP